jgi:DNA-binding NtrC family response regulator
MASSSLDRALNDAPSHAARTGGAIAQRPNAPRARVLFVDGSNDGGHTLLLETHAVTLVHTAREALRELNAGAFDACVLDYWIADWTGPALCRDIRKSDPHVPVIFYR